MSRLPPVISVIGRKNSGKTTLLVALAAELRRQGLRVASLKHGHHEFEVDEPGRDSWRHFHEGCVEAVMMVGSGKIALIARAAQEPDPQTLIEQHFSDQGFDIILVEGYKHGPFRKVEVHRSEVHDVPIHDSRSASDLLAIVTDAPVADAGYPVIPLDEGGGHVRRLAELVQEIVAKGEG